MQGYDYCKGILKYGSKVRCRWCCFRNDCDRLKYDKSEKFRKLGM